MCANACTFDTNTEHRHRFATQRQLARVRRNPHGTERQMKTIMQPMLFAAIVFVLFSFNFIRNVYVSEFRHLKNFSVPTEPIFHHCAAALRLMLLYTYLMLYEYDVVFNVIVSLFSFT